MFFKIFNKDQQEAVAPAPQVGAIKPVVLLVLDGWGIAPPSEGNAIHLAKTPNMDRFKTMYPNGQLIAAGEAVGLPANEAGNSEIGHLTLGTGRVTLQSLMKINKSLRDETFYENHQLYRAIEHAIKSKSKLHLMGLIGSGQVHSSLTHFYALLELCRRHNFKNVFIHAFTDGRDAPPDDGVGVMAQVEERLKQLGFGRIASVGGRYYGMDRDRRWERTEKAYRAIVLGQGAQATSAVEAIKASYAAGKTDEFIEPVVIMAGDKPVATVDDNDSVIFFNFRIDRPRQLTMAFVLPDFENLRDFKFGDDPHETKYKKKHGGPEVISGKTFKREKWPKNVFFATMTEYQRGLAVSAIAFPPPVVRDCLPEVLAKKGLKQLHLAESEKERMVAYYFNGMREEKFVGEDDVIVPSPKVATYDKKPEMSVFKVAEELRKALKKNIYHFAVVNFANPDMVAHSGNLKAAIKACEFADKAIGQVAEMVFSVDGTLVITADHGNAEDLLTYPAGSYFFTTQKGEINTEHSNNPIPFLVLSRSLANKPIRLPQGVQSDVAVTVLGLMRIAKPEVMTGKDLLATAAKPATSQSIANKPLVTTSQ